MAGDLRALVGALRISTTLERMGDLAEHIARRPAPLPRPAVPEELHETIREMGELAVRLVYETGDIIKSVDVAHALRLEVEDDRMDELHRQMFMTTARPGLVARRRGGHRHHLDQPLLRAFADHAVSVARRVVHQATGQRAADHGARLATDLLSALAQRPWLATALMAAAAAVRVEVPPPGTVRTHARVELVDAAGCRSGC